MNLVERRLGGWIAGLVGLAAGAGFSGLLFAYFLVRLLANASKEMWPSLLLVTLVGVVVEGVLIYAWVSHGRAIRRAEVSTRTWMVIGCWATTGANLLAFMMVAR